MSTPTGKGGGRSTQVLRPPTRSRLLHTYTSIVPQGVRAGIKAKLSPELHAFLTKRVTHAGPLAFLSDALQAFIVKRRFARFLRLASFVLAYSEHGLAVARVVPSCTPLQARRVNLGAVTDILTRASVPFFCVRGFDDLVSVVAVPESHRSAALRALAGASRHTPTYVADINGLQTGIMRPGKSARTWRHLAKVRTFRLVQFLTDPTGSAVLGVGSGCDIEFWSEQEGQLVAPRPNRAADLVQLAGPSIVLRESAFTRMVAVGAPDQPQYPTRLEMVGDLLDEIAFPIDVVYTWVDGEDPTWRAKRDLALGLQSGVLNRQSANDSRYISRDELRYSFRSIAMFAPWVRHIYLVTDDQVPPWLDVNHPQVTVISHKELFGNRGTLPTFNSHAIESQLHHIDGLAEHFIYLNDDVFLGRPSRPQTFFDGNGVSKIFLSKAKIDAGPVNIESDIPSTAAGKNNRRLIQEEFGRRVTFKMKHVPHALRRSVLTEIEGKYPAELAETARHQFRHPQDVSLTSSLYQYYTFLSERAVIGDIRYMYADLAAPETPSLLRLTLAKRNFQVFCLNDTDSEPDAFARQHSLMRDFLSVYFPVPAPWERPDEPPAGRNQLYS